MTSEVKPERPPAAIPAVDSAAATTGLLPNKPAAILAMDSARRLLLKRSGRPAISVWDEIRPIFSKTTINSSRNTAIQKTRLMPLPQSMLANTSL
ncbi:hypothetical protein D3C75_582400 [compost metagenome]